MKIIGSYFNLQSGETHHVEESGRNRTIVLLNFLRKSRKFANKEHKVLRLATDDLTTYSEFKQQYPKMNVELLEESRENLDSSPEPRTE